MTILNQEVMQRPERRRREGRSSARFAFAWRSSLFCVPVLFLYLCLLWVYVFYGFYVGSAKLQCGATPPSVMVLFTFGNAHIYTKDAYSQPRSKFAIRQFSRRNRIWSSFSPDKLARWSVATRPPYENSLSTFVELGGGVRWRRTTFRRAFLIRSDGEADCS